MKRLVLFLVFLLIIGNVNAAINQESAKNWLNQRIVWSQAPIEDISFATVVLNSQIGLNILKSKIDSQSGCVPKENCNSKDTAMASLALKQMNQNIGNQIEYLNANLKAALDLVESQWIIQIISNEEGTCEITYEEGIHNVLFDENGRITSGGEDSWVRFDMLPNFNFDKASESISIECGFSSTPIISIMKVVGNSFYIIDEKSSKNPHFIINNGCYASTPNNGCDEASSFYVSWALKKLGEELTTNNYLVDHANNEIEYSLLSYINNAKRSNLIEMQEQDGSFASKVYETSFAVDSLKNSEYVNERNSALSWIESQQNEETGEIGAGVKDTAAALYLIYGNGIPGSGDDDEGLPSCIDTGCQTGYFCNPNTDACEQLNEEDCNSNNICDNNLGENALNCINDCRCGDNVCDSTENSVSCSLDCDVETVCGNSLCESEEDDIFSNSYCSSDCTTPEDKDEDNPQDQCGDGVCGIAEDDFTCPQDCQPEKKSSLWWLWLIIIILILGGAAFFVLNKMKKGGKVEESPSYIRPKNPPINPQQYAPLQKEPRNEAMEKELDRSIREAQELLKKKK